MYSCPVPFISMLIYATSLSLSLILSVNCHCKDQHNKQVLLSRCFLSESNNGLYHIDTLCDPHRSLSQLVTIQLDDTMDQRKKIVIPNFGDETLPPSTSNDWTRTRERDRFTSQVLGILNQIMPENLVVLSHKLVDVVHTQP